MLNNACINYKNMIHPLLLYQDLLTQVRHPYVFLFARTKKLNKTIISIEDPVEIELNGINQVEIKQDDNKSEFSEFICSQTKQM